MQTGSRPFLTVLPRLFYLRGKCKHGEAQTRKSHQAAPICRHELLEFLEGDGSGFRVQARHRRGAAGAERLAPLAVALVLACGVEDATPFGRDEDARGGNYAPLFA